MKLRLLDFLACPQCRSSLRLREPAVEWIDRPAAEHAPACSGLCGARADAVGRPSCEACVRLEVWTGRLACDGCGASFAIADGIPRMAGAALVDHRSTTAQTAVSYGHLWSRAALDPSTMPASYHYEKIARTLSLAPLRGTVLDAGAGEGVDVVNQARGPGVEVVGAELSEGGCLTTARRILRVAGAHVVQADLARLPFGARTFDFIYSYGVLHHMKVPADGAAELARVARGGAGVAVYLYEDFGERAAVMRWALRASNQLRRLTTRVPPRPLYRLCQVGSPLVYFMLTAPHLLLRRVPGMSRLADEIPFRHGKGPFRLTSDLFDRFSAPVEHRYSRERAAALLSDAGLRVARMGNERGWMVLGEAP